MINFLFVHRYEQDNGQIVSAAGGLKTVQGPDGPVQALVISGAYTFVGPDGITYWVRILIINIVIKPYLI